MVQHRAERVVGVVALSGQLDRFADGDAQAARRIRILRQDGAAGRGGIGGAGDDFRAPHPDHAAPVGLLEVGDLHHVDQAFHAEHLAGESEGGAPLAGAGLGGELGDAFLLVVPGLGDGSVGLVRPGRAGAFVLEVDLRGGAEGLFPSGGPDERRRTPELVDLPNLIGDLDQTFCRHLLRDEAHREQRRQVIRTGGLMRSRVEGRGRGRGEIGRDVVPRRGDPVFREQILCRHAFGAFPSL